MVILAQVYWWLRDGVWSPLRLGLLWSGIDAVQIAPHWRGIQKIINWVGDCTLCLGLLGIGIAIWVAFPRLVAAGEATLEENSGTGRYSVEK